MDDDISYQTKISQLRLPGQFHSVMNDGMKKDNSSEEIIAKMSENMFKKAMQPLRYRIKRESQSSNSTLLSKITSFARENIECNSIVRRMCPGSGIGCSLCNYFSEGICSGVCTLKDVICNAAFMRCIQKKR